MNRNVKTLLSIFPKNFVEVFVDLVKDILQDQICD